MTEKKLIAGEIREDCTFTITFPSQRKMLNWVLNKEPKCWRYRLGFYVLWVGPGGLCLWRAQWNLGSINDAEFIDSLGDHELVQH